MSLGRAGSLFLGIFCILSGLATAFFEPSLEYVYHNILWFCHFFFLWLGVGYLLRSSFIVSAVFLVAIPVQILWDIDFLIVFFGGQGMGLIPNDYFEASVFRVVVSVIVHVGLIPLSFLGVHLLGYHKKAWNLAVVLIAIMMGLSFFTAYDLNTNCAVAPCSHLTEKFWGTVSNYVPFVIANQMLYAIVFWILDAFYLRIFNLSKN